MRSLQKMQVSFLYLHVQLPHQVFKIKGIISSAFHYVIFFFLFNKLSILYLWNTTLHMCLQFILIKWHYPNNAFFNNSINNVDNVHGIRTCLSPTSFIMYLHIILPSFLLLFWKKKNNCQDKKKKFQHIFKMRNEFVTAKGR